MAEFPDRQVYRRGRSELMPPWDGVLSKDEIGALVKYVRSLEEKPK